MRLLILKEDYEGKKRGEEIFVENNEAHRLVDNGIARIKGIGGKAIESAPRDKMITRKKRGKIKVRVK